MIYGVNTAVSACVKRLTQLDYVTNNLANVNTPGFKASSAVMKESREGGVTASVTRGEDSVEISKEAVDMLDTANGYGANLKALQVSDRMAKDILDIMG